MAKNEKDPWSEKISIVVPRENGTKEQEDVICSVNGRIYTIKRGVRVEVPKPIFEVLERSINAQLYAEEYYYSKSN